MAVKADQQERSLSEIAREIRDDWGQKTYFGAKPYVIAMRGMDRIDGTYYNDTAEDVVRRFLSNAKTWRGDVARRVKAELKAMLA